MRQVTTKLKSGKIRIIEAPIPVVQGGQILVRNHFSVISAGTEASTITAARKGYLGKAKERPQQFKQVINGIKHQGPVETYRAVMKKLDVFSALGYSSAGEVVEVNSNVKGFQIGDLVACGGFDASHAEYISVPVNLCVKLKPDADLKQAAYNTLGAIALQGVRLADLRLGETCAVIGLGLIGQLTALLLRASGVRVAGIDVNKNRVGIAREKCVDLALHRNEAGIESKILTLTGEIGCDAVIITAASNSLDPINFAGLILRKKGQVIVVGDIPTGFDREPYFYKKELSLKMSCSYGPGRYDPIYEEKGIDYPPGYIRWTEKRNMQAFQELICSEKIDIRYLTTHTFKLEDAPAGYELILAKSEPYHGILIEYDASKKIDFEKRKISIKLSASSAQPSSVCIGFIGAGSYAQGHLLPNIPKKKNNVFLKGVMTTKGTSSRSAAERFGFDFCTSVEKDIFDNKEINTVFIATRHDSHAHYVIESIKAGKHVFVEKPLCLTIGQLHAISDLLKSNSMILNDKILMVGYNRRFSPLTQIIKNTFNKGPMAIVYRINAGMIPADSWIHDSEAGGGRIIGEVCHFIDFLTYIIGATPISGYATLMKNDSIFEDIISISLSYKDGSIGTICYFSNGGKGLSKERVEIYGNGCTAVLDDFKTLSIYAKKEKKVKRMIGQNKGQKNEIEQFIAAIQGREAELIPFDEIYNTSLVTFRIVESIRTGKCFKI